MTHHCRWCRLVDWIFEEPVNVSITVAIVCTGIILLSSLLFVACVAGAALLDI